MTNYGSVESTGTPPVSNRNLSVNSMGNNSADDENSRRSSSTRASFLNTVKQVQVSRRLEKLAKMRREGSEKNGLMQEESLRSDLTTDEIPPTVPEGAGDEEEMNLSTVQVLCNIFFGKGFISACLLAAPLALLANFLGWSDTAKFWLNFVTMIPLASILGDFTEEVALHTNEVRVVLVNEP